jgi:hypothetical protein
MDQRFDQPTTGGAPISGERKGGAVPMERSFLARVPSIVWVAVVALLACLTQLVMLGSQPFGWDETIYISQNANDVPSAFLSAPRSRGTGWLVWPIAHFTVNTVAVNVYLSLLSAVTLVLAFLPWTKLLSRAVVVLASFWFAFLWVSLFFGPSAWPNYWLAVACVSAVGWFIIAANDGARWPALWAGLSVAVAGVLRFSDAAWLVAALVVCALVIPAWRRRFWLLGVVVVGFAVGVVPWLVEAYLNFGGPFARLASASDIQGGTSPSLNLLNVLRSAAGPDILCRPCRASVSRPYLLFLLIAAALVVLAVIVAWRERRRRVVLVPAVCAVAVLMPYLFLLHYSAARFLLPAYGLAAIPLAYGLVWLCRPSRLQPVAIALVALALAGNLVFQLALTRTAAQAQVKRVGIFPKMAAQITDRGVTPPCVVAGKGAPPIGFYTRCRSVAAHGPNKNVTAAELRGLAGQYPMAVVVKAGAQPPEYATGWESFPVAGRNRWTIYYSAAAG